jgi:V-type H+-transporting ATPase subunit E
MSGYGELATDSFELKRVMRQEAHEKAFEIRVMSQRMFEKEKANIVLAGKHKVDANIDKSRRELTTEMNIKRSTQVNKARMKKMNVRDDLMQELVRDTLKLIETELSSPKNPEYRQAMKKLLMQGMIKLLEKKVMIKCREMDVDLITGLLEETQQEFADYMEKETQRDEYTCELEIYTDNYIKADSAAGRCGGIVLCTVNKLIVCSNTLNERLNLCYDHSLPILRSMLFPK